MNQVLQEAAQGTSYGWLVGISTAFFLAVFAAMLVWVMSRRKADMDEAANIPFEED